MSNAIRSTCGEDGSDSSTPLHLPSNGCDLNRENAAEVENNEDSDDTEDI